MSVVIEAQQLTKMYGSFSAVQGISFKVEAQECFGLLGPNGAGKTTTVKMIYCFSPVTSGLLQVLGDDVSKKPREVKQKLGVVSQEDSLDNDLTVWENLVIYAGYYAIPKKEAERRAEELLDFAGLADRAKTKVEELSGGMKRRLTIARALVNKPELLILDEPTTGLDPQARHIIWQKLRQLKSRGVTLILTTHYLEEASQLCDRLVIMDEGRILAEGEPGQLIARHIGSQVIEISMQNSWESLLKQVQPYLKGYKAVGEVLYLYPLEADALWSALQKMPYHYVHQLLRPATLEDVFLKLAGKELEV